MGGLWIRRRNANVSMKPHELVHQRQQQELSRPEVEQVSSPASTDTAACASQGLSR